MSDQPLVVVAVTTAKPGMGAKLRTAQEQLVADTLREEGCLSFALHQDRENPDVLVFVESWRDHATWRAHMTGEAMQRFRNTGAGELFAGSQLHQLDKVAG